MDTNKSAGTYLKEAREAAQLSCTQVAEALRLRTSVIHAIEKEELKNIGVPTTFIRGYIKNYARLLKLSEKPILPLLETLYEADEVAAEHLPLTHVTSLPNTEFNWRKWLLITILVIGSLIFLI